MPTVEGKFQVGETLTATAGTWTNSPTEFQYEWLRCSSGGGGCVAIAGATAKRYKLVKADVDHTVRVAVSSESGRQGDGAFCREPARLRLRGPAQRDAPRDIRYGAGGRVAHRLDGQLDGRCALLHVPVAALRPPGQQLRRCLRRDGETYGVRSADVGHTVRVEVTAHNAAGKTTVNTDRSDLIGKAAGTTTTVTNTETTTETSTVEGNRPPALRFISLRVRRNRVYVRLQVCDDSSGRVRVTTRDQMARRLAYTRHFTVRVTGCTTRSRSWSLVKRFRAHKHRFVVSVRAADDSGALSRLVSRSVRLR